MRIGIIGSAVLHAVVIGATMVAFPRTLDFASQDVPYVPVELVTVAEVTNIAAQVKDEPEPEPKEPEVPQEIAPEEMIAALEPEPAPIEPEAAPAEPEEKKATPAKPEPRQKPKPEKKKQEFNLDRILADLEKKPKAASASNATKSDRIQKGFGAQSAMTMNIQDAMRNQIKPCWNVPAGAPEPEKLIVAVDIHLAPDGSIARAPELSRETEAAAAGNAFMRTAAENALRAIHVCAPYNLPPESYSVWSDLQVVFDPSKMVGR